MANANATQVDPNMANLMVCMTPGPEHDNNTTLQHEWWKHQKL